MAKLSAFCLLCTVLVSPVNAQLCADSDGDGWGWDGQKSCQVTNNPGTVEQTGSEGQVCVDDDNDGWGWDGEKSCRVGAAAEPGQSQSNSSNQSQLSEGTGLTIASAACEVESGSNQCDVFAEYNLGGSGPHCLFEVQGNNSQGSLLTCGNPTRIRVPVAANQSKILELRSGSVQYSNSQLVARRSVVGIAGVKRGAYSLQDTRRSVALRNNRATSIATTWDSRLHFVVLMSNGKRVSVVRAFRPEGMDYKSAEGIQAPGLFSTGRVFSSENMSGSEKANSTVKVPGALGNNLTGTEVPFNMAVYPDNRLVNNPYRSDAAGNIADQGQYETYRFYVLAGTSGADNVASEYDLVKGTAARGKKKFLTRYEASVVVRNAGTTNAEVHDVIVHSRARPLRDTQGNLIYGYESSVTLDGRLIIYSGNTSPALRNGNGGEVNYIYQADQQRLNGWSRPRGLADMYYVHGPGSASGETMLSNNRFSEHFPVAAYPIREYNGQVLGQGDVIRGSYPWVSLRGSEVFFMGRAAFSGAFRIGATMGGFRTAGQLWHLDGDINNNRGNPTDSYDHFMADNSSQYTALVSAYESRRYRGTNTVMGKNTWTNLFFRPLGQFPTSWSAVTDMAKSAFPMNGFAESYGFWLSGNRYYETTFPLYPKDLVAYYPMNEPLYRDQSMLRPWAAAAAGAPNNEAIRRSAIDYVKDKTADLSSNQYTATLRNGALYPFEHYAVKSQWANSRLLKDQTEGAVGNSIFFRRAGAATAQIKSQSAQQIDEQQSLSAALWFNSNALGQSARLLQLAGLLDLSVSQNQLVATIRNDGSTEVFRANVSVQSNRWHHVAMSWRLGALRLYFDGREVARYSATGDFILSGGAIDLVMGPNGSGSQNLLLKLDEVYVYASHLSAGDIATLAYKKRIYGSSQNSFFSTSGMASDYTRLPADTDLSFTASAAETALGEQLFNSTALSRDGSVSCASCHQETRSFSDGQRLSTGISNRQGTLNTPSISNALLGRHFFYSGAAASLETQTIHTIMQNGEMGLSDASRIVDSLPQNLRDKLRQLYGVEPAVSQVARSLAAYVRTIRVAGAPDNNLKSLSAAAQRGRRLFNGKANCIACHTGSNHTNNQFHDIGLNAGSSDRAAATHRRDDRFRQKTPTLRNVALTAPYFHDGSAADLHSVVRHYNDKSHKAAGRTTDALLHPLELSSREIDDLVEYLSALNGTVLTR